jgi:GNAT superfamily N-acetyltransferase
MSSLEPALSGPAFLLIQALSIKPASTQFRDHFGQNWGMLQLSPATENDLPAILSFIEKLAAYEKLSGMVEITAQSLREALFGERPYAEVILARIDGSPAGFALFFYTYSTFLGKPGLWLEDLFVEEAHRGKGVGTALMVELARIARARGCGRFEWSVLDWNTPSIEFYKGLGAALMKEWIICRVTGKELERLADKNVS